MNLCLIVQNPYPKDVRVRKEAMALRSRGHNVSVIALRDPNEAKYEVVDNIKIYRGGIQKKRGPLLRYLIEYITFFLFAAFKLNILDLKEKFDVVHINTLPDFLVFAGIVQKAKGRKIILDMHEIAPEFFMSKFGVSIKHPLVRLLLFVERISLKFADDVITINEPIKEIFQKRAIPDRPVTVVMNTADASMVGGNGKRPHQTFNCVYHGTLTDIYGLDTAIKGFSRTCRNVADMVFHIFGAGPQLSELECLAQELNLQQFIVFHGEVPHDKMIEALEDMDLAILATRKDVFLNLSFSNKLAEYVSLKIPVISSDLDATKYYFTSEQILYFEAGNVDDLAQKILFAYRNTELMQKMAASAYERAKSFEWAIMAKRYVEVVEGHQPGRPSEVKDR